MILFAAAPSGGFSEINLQLFQAVFQFLEYI
jgi:hypothetical protein